MALNFYTSLGDCFNSAGIILNVPGHLHANNRHGGSKGSIIDYKLDYTTKPLGEKIYLLGPGMISSYEFSPDTYNAPQYIFGSYSTTHKYTDINYHNRIVAWMKELSAEKYLFLKCNCGRTCGCGQPSGCYRCNKLFRKHINHNGEYKCLTCNPELLMVDMQKEITDMRKEIVRLKEEVLEIKYAPGAMFASAEKSFNNKRRKQNGDFSEN